MSTREEMSALVADIVSEHFERLRADLLEKLLALRSPNFALTPMGELYCDGQKVGDVRPVFREVLAEVLAKRDGGQGGA